MLKLQYFEYIGLNTIIKINFISFEMWLALYFLLDSTWTYSLQNRRHQAQQRGAMEVVNRGIKRNSLWGQMRPLTISSALLPKWFVSSGRGLLESFLEKLVHHG